MEPLVDSAVEALIRGSPMAFALYVLGRVALKGAQSAWQSWLTRFDAGRASVDALTAAIEKLNGSKSE